MDVDPLSLIGTLLPGPIWECLLDYLPIGALVDLQRTCRHFADMYRYALPTRWRIDDYLTRWLLDPKVFRDIMKKEEAIISGSAALRFFDHTAASEMWTARGGDGVEYRTSPWQPNDLDVYITSWSCWKMHKHLTTIQGCKYLGSKSADEARYPVDNLSEVKTYARWSDVTWRPEKIQVICIYPHAYKDKAIKGEERLVATILAGFHSTAILNYLTHREAVSLYPYSTFVQRRNYLKKPFQSRVEDAAKKYMERGWMVHDLAASDEKLQAHPMRKARHLGDKMCWRIEYGSEGRSRLPTPQQQDGRHLTSRSCKAHQAKHLPLWPLWWTTDEYIFHTYRDIGTGSGLPAASHSQDHTDTVESPRRVSRMETRYYLFIVHGLLSSNHEDLFSVLSALSVSHPAHRTSLHIPSAPGRLVYCNRNGCPRRVSGNARCITEDENRLPRHPGGYGATMPVDVEPSEVKASSPAKVDSTGYCASLEELIRAAEEAAERKFRVVGKLGEERIVDEQGMILF